MENSNKKGEIIWTNNSYYLSDKIRQVLRELEKPDRKAKKLFDTAWTGGYNERNAEFEADKNRILSGLEK